MDSLQPQKTASTMSLLSYGVDALLPSQVDIFWLGLLHHLWDAVAANRFNIIGDEAANILKRFEVCSGPMGRKNCVFGLTYRVIFGQRLLWKNVDPGRGRSSDVSVGACRGSDGGWCPVG
jgi:hypothetical protein